MELNEHPLRGFKPNSRPLVKSVIRLSVLTALPLVLGAPSALLHAIADDMPALKETISPSDLAPPEDEPATAPAPATEPSSEPLHFEDPEPPAPATAPPSEPLPAVTPTATMTAEPVAEPEPPAQTQPPAEAPGEKPKPGELPKIKARTYDVLPKKRSKSNRVYLFSDVTEAKPRPGRILLLREGDQQAMAFRVLKTYPEKKEFAAKRVKTYDGKATIDLDRNFMAIEKLSDVPLPPPTLQDQQDLKELEDSATPKPAQAPETVPMDNQGLLPDDINTGTKTDSGKDNLSLYPEILPFDPDLDGGSSPTPEGTKPEEVFEPSYDGEDDHRLSLTAEEVNQIERTNHGASLQLGFFRNGTPQGQSQYFKGGGLRYGYTPAKMMLLRLPQVQDSITLEGGAFFYKVLAKNNDGYSVLAFNTTVRYNIILNEDYGVFFYGGLTRNQVTSSAQGREDMLTALSSSFPAGGGGLLFRIGPHWEARLDIGIDMMTGGLMLRF